MILFCLDPSYRQHYSLRAYIDDFIDEQREIRYRRDLWLNAHTFGLWPVREPVYLYSGGWNQ